VARTPSLTGLLLSPRQRRWASAGFGWWRRAVAPTLLRGVLHSKRKPARTIKARSASKIRSKAAGSGQPKGRANSKQARVLALLCGPSGATIATVTRSTGWQPHTVRGFLAAVVRKKLGLRLESKKTDISDVAGKAAGDATSVPSA
jgi:Protein of unknown function (DUF3489)